MLILEQSQDDKIKILKDAIENKYSISFWYRGDDYVNRKKSGKKANFNVRFAEPIAIGTSKASGKILLRAWQYGGTTNLSKPKTGGKPAWKTFLVDEMSYIVIFDGVDGGYRAFDKPGGPNFNPSGDKKMSNVDKIINLNTPKGVDRSQKQEQPPEVDTDVDIGADAEKIRESSGFLKWLLN